MVEPGRGKRKRNASARVEGGRCARAPVVCVVDFIRAGVGKAESGKRVETDKVVYGMTF
jgi:hypothetical protein